MTRAVDTPAPVSRGATVAAWAYAAAVAIAIGHFLLGIPIQLSDSYGNMLKLDTPWLKLVTDEFWQRGYLRPFLFAELKLVYDASRGDYFTWFRGTQVVQVAGLLGLYLGLARPRGWREALLVPLGIAVLLGMHTFRGAIVEAFPVNTFLTILLCCFAAASLSLMAHRWWVDVLAVLLFVVAALTVESGLLVAVILIGAALVGARGVSRPALAAVGILLIGYFVLRFAVLDVGSPGLMERSSGYGFRMLEPRDLMVRFAGNPYPFYAYNVVTSAASVLFAEPRAGMFGLVYGMTIGDPYPPAIVNVIACTLGTVLIGVCAWQRRDDWLARRFGHDDRLVLIFLFVLGANAAITYPYTKDVIMSPAGAFYALAVFAAGRQVLSDSAVRRSSATRAAVVVLCAAGGVCWALRFAAVPLSLRETARKVRTEWAYAESWFETQNMDVKQPRQRALFERLRNDAIYTHPAPPPLPIADHWLLDID